MLPSGFILLIVLISCFRLARFLDESLPIIPPLLSIPQRGLPFRLASRDTRLRRDGVAAFTGRGAVPGAGNSVFVAEDRCGGFFRAPGLVADCDGRRAWRGARYTGRAAEPISVAVCTHRCVPCGRRDSRGSLGWAARMARGFADARR